MSVKRSESSQPTPSRALKPIAVSKERRTLIDTQVGQLSAAARRIAVELPFSADVSDYVRVLEEAGNA
jgi:hypothetical protein